MEYWLEYAVLDFFFPILVQFPFFFFGREGALLRLCGTVGSSLLTQAEHFSPYVSEKPHQMCVGPSPNDVSRHLVLASAAGPENPEFKVSKSVKEKKKSLIQITSNAAVYAEGQGGPTFGAAHI